MNQLNISLCVSALSTSATGHTDSRMLNLYLLSKGCTNIMVLRKIVGGENRGERKNLY